MTKEEYLKELNKAFGDFIFFEEDHHYEYKGQRVGISVTRLIEYYTNEFDSQAIAEKVATKNQQIVDRISKDRWATEEDIELKLKILSDKTNTIQGNLDLWEYKNKFACEKGSTCHEYAQALWNDEEWIYKPFDNNCLEYQNAVRTICSQAIMFHFDYQDRLEHLSDEFVIGSEEYNIASAIDHLFINKLTGGLVLVDYKTNSDIHKNERYAKNMKVPLSHLKDDTLTHYAIQLSIYKYIVEKYTNLKFEEMFIVYFSENIDNYEIIEIPYLKDEVIKILENRREKNMESIGVLLMGASGTGKSTSLRNLPAEETAIINVTNKPMPFRNKNGLKITNCTNYEQMINAIIKTNKRIIVIDDSSYMMTFENFDKATQKGYDKFTTMAVNYYNLIETPKKCDGEKIIYFITHEEIDENGITHPKSIGKMLSQQLVIEGLFSIVLRSMQKENQYVFQTHNDGTSVCKSPMDMFNDDFIPNDLAEVDKVIREYYGFKPITEKLNKEEGEE